jgi:butyrate kinase
MGARKVLVVNPGSTSDEVALFDGFDMVFHKVMRYSVHELEPFDGQKVTAQFDFRKELVLKSLEERGVQLSELAAVAGRGGLVRPIPSGTYTVDENLLVDLREGVMGDHPSNLGGIIAHSIASVLGIPAFIADPVVVDEMEPLARYSGMPENPRISIIHALNQKRVARNIAKKLGRSYETCNFIVCHAGGGISVGAHCQGRIVDVNNGLDGDGPFTPQRAGGVPAGGLAKMCFSGKYTHNEIKLKLKGKGGVVAYAGTSDLVILEKLIDGRDLSEGERSQLKPDLTPTRAKEILDALAYQVSKEIASLGAVLKGKIDAIILTGGLANGRKHYVVPVMERVGWMAPVEVIPGGDEMAALNDAVQRVLSGEEKALSYV